MSKQGCVCFLALTCTQSATSRIPSTSVIISYLGGSTRLLAVQLHLHLHLTCLTYSPCLSYSFSLLSCVLAAPHHHRQHHRTSIDTIKIFSQKGIRILILPAPRPPALGFPNSTDQLVLHLNLDVS